MNKREDLKKSGSLIRFATFMIHALLLSLAFTACGKENVSSKENESGTMNNTKTVVRYVALGDSTGVGVGARDGGYVIRLFNKIDREIPSSSLTNLCVSGATSSDLIHEQLEPGIAARPTLVTIGIGINDVARGVTEEAFASNLETLVARLKAETSASIVITNLPDVSLAPVVPADLREQLRSRILTFNQQIKATADRHGLFTVDVYSNTRDLIPKHPEFFSADKFHPSDMGYEFWATQMWPTVQKAINKK